ncbi:MAG: ABC transporter permease [Acidisphaera sp.]|nr:ABC transporter permease [Acidisphaera sp.]
MSDAAGSVRDADPVFARVMTWLAPVLVGVVFLGGWELLVRANHIPVYILPGPVAIATKLWADWGTLSGSLLVTLQITLAALLVAVIGGGGLAVLFAQSRWVERSLFPYAVILQVTPIVAIAPLILIYVPNTRAALLICAWIVAFFPILSNTTLGLNSVDPNFVDLMQLYRARRWQVLWLLRLPGAMPYFLGGLRIAGGLSLIGAVVAEFAAGTAGAGSGLAYRILESGYRLDIARMYAGLVLLSLTGIVIFAAFSVLSWLMLHRWHESAARRER